MDVPERGRPETTIMLSGLDFSEETGRKIFLSIFTPHGDRNEVLNAKPLH
jgi:hypothetical protein